VYKNGDVLNGVSANFSLSLTVGIDLAMTITISSASDHSGKTWLTLSIMFPELGSVYWLKGGRENGVGVPMFAAADH